MSFQHGPGLWVKKETKHLARMSAEFVKGAIGTVHDQHEDRSQTDAMDTNSIWMVPEALQMGVMMTKVLANKQKRLIFRLDPDEGRILYKSTKYGIGTLSVLSHDNFINK
jgi:hypothetical protein